MTSPSAPSKVILLSNTGFIGRALEADLAARGLEVHGFSSATLDLRQPSALSTLDDVLDASSCLVVTAATAPGNAMTSAALATNVAMIANLATYLETHPIKTCVYLSSDAVYPMIDADVTEDTPTDLTSFYPLSKHAAERMLDVAARKTGAALVVIRPTAVYGPGDTHNGYGPNRFARTAAADHVVRLFGEGEETRDHIYIDDAVRAIGALSERGQAGVFNVATGSSQSFMAVAEAVRAVAPFDVDIVTSPRQSAITHRRFDVSRLLAALPGFQFTPLEVGLRATLADAAASKASA